MKGQRNLYLLSAFFTGAGVMHFIIPGHYAAIIPRWIPFPMGMVYVSGVFEILGGVGVLIPRVRKLAAIGLIALLIAVFPANVQMLTDAFRTDSSTLYRMLTFLRLPLQPLMMIWIYKAALRERSAG